MTEHHAMPTPRLCPVCGAPLPGDAPRGLCPKCLLATRGAEPAAPAPGSPDFSDTPTLADSRNTRHATRFLRYFGDYELLDEFARAGTAK